MEIRFQRILLILILGSNLSVIAAEQGNPVPVEPEIERRQVTSFTQTIINKSAAKVHVTPLDKL